MAEGSFQFDSVTELSVWAKGVPGQRTFYLAVGDDDSWLRIWVEKEQLQVLADAIDQLADYVSGPVGSAQEEKSLKLEPQGDPTMELDLGRMTLGYQEDEKVVLLQIHDAEAAPSSPATVNLKASLSQMRILGHSIKEVCAAGRPLCPMCKAPINPEGHLCVRANGHHKLVDIQE